MLCLSKNFREKKQNLGLKIPIFGQFKGRVKIFGILSKICTSCLSEICNFQLCLLFNRWATDVQIFFRCCWHKLSYHTDLVGPVASRLCLMALAKKVWTHGTMIRSRYVPAEAQRGSNGRLHVAGVHRQLYWRAQEKQRHPEPPASLSAPGHRYECQTHVSSPAVHSNHKYVLIHRLWIFHKF